MGRTSDTLDSMKPICRLLPIVTFAFAPGAFGQTTYTYTSVDYPGVGYTQLNGINSSGAIVGVYRISSVGNVSYSFLRSPDGSSTQLLAGTSSNAAGISDSGSIVGSVDKVGFILSPGFTPVKVSNDVTALNGISTNNSIIGTFDNGSGVYYGIGFETVSGKLMPLPFYDELSVTPRGINKGRTIVGDPNGNPEVAFILPPGGTYQIVEYPGSNL